MRVLIRMHVLVRAHACTCVRLTEFVCSFVCARFVFMSRSAVSEDVICTDICVCLRVHIF